MKAWIIPIILAVVMVGTTVYAILLNLSPATVFASGPGETISGLKRWPGTWDEDTIKVQAGEDLGEPDVTIDVNVLRPVFAPNEIRVKQGQVVRLLLHGLDSGLADMPGVDEAIGLQEFSGHGLQILGPYDIWITGIRKGVTREVIFKADVAGEFPFECTVFCSPQHYLMQGKLIVEPG
jgi:heme/copper-type cytochrome/quinol oxidase subunit 2